MSEKRFELDYDDEDCACISNFVNNGEKLTDREVVDLLNKLYEENEQLKKSEKINMEYAEQIVKENQKLRIAKNDLRIENEQLKQKNNFLKQIREAFQIDVKNSRQMLKGRDSDE